MRLRFAPSPTGYLHIGNARTAILNYLIAKKTKGSLVLRIEDTDKERSTPESEKSIIEDLKWLGIDWDEGPDKNGNFGPYRQTERFAIYHQYAEKLLSEKKAYFCYCSHEELDGMRKEASAKGRPFVYPGKCRNLSDKEQQDLRSEGRMPTVRFRVNDNQTIEIDDLIKGKITFSSENIGGDFIIVRSDGSPVYNFIVIIDDTLMEITHVIRGEDHLPNTPKQALIARALELPVPHYAHLALVLGPDRSKLSKRHGITSVDLYRKEGYLPEAMVNYLSLLGWATESGEEILSLQHIINEIEISNLAKSAAVFDFNKLKWMNSNYIRNFPVERAIELFTPYLQNAGYNVDNFEFPWLKDVIDLIRGNCEILSDVTYHIRPYIDEICEPDAEARELLNEDYAKEIIKSAHALITSGLSPENLASELINKIKDTTSLKGKKLFLPIRVILTGMLHGPELDRAIQLIGFDRCKKRIEYAFEHFL